MVSIIMPAYNAENYIREAVESVLSQTYSKWELLIIDDCSTDSTYKIVESYTQNNNHIRYIKNHHNIGVAETRNKGINKALGEWIAFLDSDDKWAPQKLEKLINLAQKQKAEFVFSGSSFIDENSVPLDFYLAVPDHITYRELLKQNIISCSSVLIRKDLIIQYPMQYASRIHEDFAVWLQILRDKNINAYGLNEPLLIYRITAGSKSGNKIKAGIMTFRVYRYIGISIIPACYYWFIYFVKSLRKYSHLLH